MKIIALEEHFITPEIHEAWAKLDPTFQEPVVSLGDQELKDRLNDFTDLRIKQMDESGALYGGNQSRENGVCGFRFEPRRQRKN